MQQVLAIFILLILTTLEVVADDNLTIAQTKSGQEDRERIAVYQERCRQISSFIVKSSFKLDCFTNYSHYGPTAKKVVEIGAVKIANYNLLHPGTSKALFKDYSLVAKIMNRYDIVSGLELLATVGSDEQNNKAVLLFIESTPNLLLKLQQEKARTTAPAKVQELTAKINQLTLDLKKAQELYRAPGYLKVLQELKKLDSSWSLILSPRGDAALVGSVEELVGYYYRANVATPTLNPHCKEVMKVGAGSPVACFITLEKSFMGKDVVRHFARRPFMASFKVGAEKITLVSSHVVFTYSGDEEAQKDLMLKTFGVERYQDLGPGINAANFARYAEVKNTLEFMNRYRKKYQDKKIMYLADTNLVSKNAFWPEVLKAYPGSELLIREGSTLSPTRYTGKGVPTEGVANDYDHFILESSAFSTCSKGEVLNYYKDAIYKDIQSRYVVRKETASKQKSEQVEVEESEKEIVMNDRVDGPEGDILPIDEPEIIKFDYPFLSGGENKMNRFVESFEKHLGTVYTIKRNVIVQDDVQTEERLEALKTRVFLRQLTNLYYYRFTQEILSDHFPVSITCKF